MPPPAAGHRRHHQSNTGHFVVEEVLPYAACGEGEHVYVTFRRTGWNTADAARSMQKHLGLAPSDVGWGGRKDKTAVVVQTLSFRCGVNHPLSEVEGRLGRPAL
jgi:tRNA pseudouridine13 synthase